jgi:hypothetical protein
MNTHAINWFEIPVADFDRAKNFYETIFAYQMPESQMGPARMGFLLYDFQNGGRGGQSCITRNFTPLPQTVRWCI